METHRYITAEEVEEVIWTPRLKRIFDETRSEVLLEEDRYAVQVKLVLGDLVWFRYRLRDRRDDGAGWKRTPVVDWPYGGIGDAFRRGPAVEESSYFLDPRYPLTDIFTEEQARFITNPFEELPFENPNPQDLSSWLDRWVEIYRHPSLPLPGYFCLKNIPGLRKHIFEEVKEMSRCRGYEFLTAVPTWWHVAGIYEFFYFTYYFSDDQNIIDRIKGFFATHKIEDRRRQSWIVMLQFWAELVEQVGMVPEEFSVLVGDKIIRDDVGRLITFPLTPTKNLWQICRL